MLRIDLLVDLPRLHYGHALQLADNRGGVPNLPGGRGNVRPNLCGEDLRSDMRSPHLLQHVRMPTPTRDRRRHVRRLADLRRDLLDVRRRMRRAEHGERAHLHRSHLRWRDLPERDL